MDGLESEGRGRAASVRRAGIAAAGVRVAAGGAALRARASPAPRQLMAPCPKMMLLIGSLLLRLQEAERKRRVQGRRRGAEETPLGVLSALHCAAAAAAAAASRGPGLPRLSARTVMRLSELKSAWATPTATPSVLQVAGDRGPVCVACWSALGSKRQRLARRAPILPCTGGGSGGPRLPDAVAAAKEEGGLGY